MATDIPMVDAAPLDTDGILPTLSVVERWTAEELFNSKPIQKSFGSGKSRETFKAAEINGKTFLERGNIEDFWRRDCQLPLGPSIELARLARRIKSIAIEATEDENIKKLHSQIQKVSCEVSKYCDPNQKQLIPFPSPLTAPARFKLDQNDCFEFYGRSKFRELYEVARSMNWKQNRRYFFHGALGAGKSHLLAALACLLMREGKPVVYISDCNELLADTVDVFRTALEFAYYGDELFWSLRQEVVEEHIALERLTHFCRVAKKSGPAFFIVDQANALDDETVRGSQRFSKEKKERVRTLLDATSGLHLKLESSTANYKHAWMDSRRQTSEKRIGLYCGLDEEEMKAWWTANGKKLTDQLRPSHPFEQPEMDYLEELTGRMPILLQALATVKVENSSEDADIAVNVDASSNIYGIPTRLTPLYDALYKSDEVRTLIDCMNAFWTNQEKVLTEDLKHKYWNAVLACLTCDIADRSALELLDWRYFYVDDDKRGHTTCGVVRLVAGALLRRVKNIDDFRDPVWKEKTEMSGQNPTVLGFHVEHLILLRIFRHGCLVAGSEFGNTRKHKVFAEDMPPSLEPDFDGTILYRPASFNFREVDGILVHRQKKYGEQNEKAVVVGIQITIAAMHSNSEEQFFRSWKLWKSHMRCGENIEFRFLWIVEKRKRLEQEVQVAAKTRKLRAGGTKVVAPEYRSIETTVEEVDQTIGDSLKRARELALE